MLGRDGVGGFFASTLTWIRDRVETLRHKGEVRLELTFEMGVMVMVFISLTKREHKIREGICP